MKSFIWFGTLQWNEQCERSTKSDKFFQTSVMECVFKTTAHTYSSHQCKILDCEFVADEFELCHVHLKMWSDGHRHTKYDVPFPRHIYGDFIFDKHYMAIIAIGYTKSFAHLMNRIRLLWIPTQIGNKLNCRCRHKRVCLGVCKMERSILRSPKMLNTRPIPAHGTQIAWFFPFAIFYAPAYLMHK